MSVKDTKGVSGVARILSRLADGTPRTAAELARTEALSRSAAFELVRKLEAAQLIARDDSGKLTVGPQAKALAFARFGLARLHGPGEALVRWLSDHCEATAALTCAANGERVTLVSVCADRARPGAKERPSNTAYPICDGFGRELARLELFCRPNGSRSERAEIESLALRAKATLERHLCGDAKS
jgi:hypothetical protein